MLSRRAVNTLRKIAVNHPFWRGFKSIEYFARSTHRYIKSYLQLAKKAGELKGCGEKTIQKILEYHADIRKHHLVLKK